MISKRLICTIIFLTITALSCESDSDPILTELQSSGFRTLVYEHQSVLYAYDIASKREVVLRDYDIDYNRSESVNLESSVDPSGTEVVFAAYDFQKYKLIKCNLKTGNVEELAIDGDYIKCPKWSPDGERIAVLFDNEDSPNESRIVKRTIDGRLEEREILTLAILERTTDGKFIVRDVWDCPPIWVIYKEMHWTDEGTHVLIKLSRDSTAKFNVTTGETEEIFPDHVIYEGADNSKISLAAGHSIYFEDSEGRKKLLLESAERISFINTTEGGEFVIFSKEKMFGKGIYVIHVPSQRICRLFSMRRVGHTSLASLHLLK